MADPLSPSSAGPADGDWPGLLCTVRWCDGQGWRVAWASRALQRLCEPAAALELHEAAALRGLLDAVERQAGTQADIDVTYEVATGPARWLHARGQWQREARGAASVCCTIDDLTAVRRTEDELLAQRRMLDRLTRHVPGAILVIHVPPDYIGASVPYASDGLREVYEMSHAEVRDDPGRLVQRIHPEDRDRVRDAVRQSLGSAGPFRTEYRVQLPQRGERWLSSQRQTLLLPDASTMSYEVLTDVTERKQIEQQLVERDRLLHSLGRHVPGMTFRFSVRPGEGLVLDYVSEGVRELFEWSPDECRHNVERLFERVHPDDLAKVQRRASSARSQAGVTSNEYRVTLPIRGTRWHSAHASSEVNADGTTEWYGHIADITHQKLYDEAKVAAEAAERASRHKSEFLSRMSHELRTPLNAVLGFSQLLRIDRSEVLSDSQREKVELIEQAGAHLLAVIGDVLDLSQIEAGSMPVSLQPLAVAPVLGEALALVSPLAAKSGVCLATPLLPAQVHLVGDPLRLRQVLVNLLSNAVKYNRPGGEVNVSVWRDGEWVAIEVADTGRGLTPEQCAHLFEPFNRLGAERSGVEGTGIGLVIVNRLVGLMQGNVSVRSSAEGSRFCVRLPAAVATPAGIAAIDPLMRQPARPAELLYVEDNEVNVLLVQQIMTLRPAWRLRVARSGHDALAAMRSQRPDLVLLDMHLGDMSGFELAALLDREPGHASVPRIALSADAMPEQIHAASLKGFAAYLTKPIDVSRLLACLDEQLRQRAAP